MNQDFIITPDYHDFISQIKHNIAQARNRAVRSVNSELIRLYFSIGQQIVEKQKSSDWGTDLIGQIESDLKKEFPDMTGFSRRNLNYMRNLYIFFGEDTKVQQLVAQIPWGHTRIFHRSPFLQLHAQTLRDNRTQKHRIPSRICGKDRILYHRDRS